MISGVRVQHSKPFIGTAEERAMVRVVRSARLAGGPVLGAFEHALAARIGAPFVRATSSGSAALHAALVAMKIGPGDDVVLPTYVCAAVLNAVNYVGAKPVLADVDSRTGNVTVETIRRVLTRRARAVIVAHMFGLPAPVLEIHKLGVPVIEDCAMALGGGCGSTGDLAVFSFYATKVMTTGQGGAVATSSNAYARRLEDLFEYDNRDDYRVRYNYRMGAIEAAMGLEQLKRLDFFVRRRREIANRYIQAFEKLPVGLPPPEGHLFYRFVLDVGSKRKSLEDHLKARGIESKRPVYRPLHLYFGRGGDFPGAERLHRQGLSIPIYPAMSDREVQAVIRAVRSFF